MIRIGFGLFLLAALVAGVPGQAEQIPQNSTHPDLTGIWLPAEPAKSSVLFNKGMGWVPGNGRIVIEQRQRRLTLTKYVPDDILEPLLAIQGQFYQTVIYRIVQSQDGPVAPAPGEKSVHLGRVTVSC